MSYQIHRSLVSAVHSLVRLSRNIYTIRTLCGTHYETLKLSRNCTTKDVRDSFIRLSKQYHPDKNQNDPTTHAQFVKLNEAYHILSRPNKRRAYDLTLKPERKYNLRHESTPFDVYTTAYRQRVVWRDESFWEYQDKTKYDYDRDRGYYGIRGLKRVPNSWIAIFCFVFSALGVWLQVFLIRKSRTFNRERLDERSHEASKMLSEVQEQAMIHGNKVQLERMKQRLDTSQASNGSSNKKATQQPQETSDISESNGNAKKMTRPYNTSGPTVTVLPDTETQELLEKSKWFHSTPGFSGETPHSLESESKDATTKPEFDIITSPSKFEREKADMSLIQSISMLIPPHKLWNTTSEEKSAVMPTKKSLDEMMLLHKSRNVTLESEKTDISVMQDVDIVARLCKLPDVMTKQNFMSHIPPVTNPHFEIVIGNGHDIKITNHQNVSVEERPQEIPVPTLFPEVILMTEPGEVFCEFEVVNKV